MYGTAELTDGLISAAASGSKSDVAHLAKAMSPQVRLMVGARLSATLAQFHAVEDIAQQVMVGVTSGLGGLRNQTVAGLKAYTSRIVANKVADFLRRKPSPGTGKPFVRSLDSTVVGYSEAGPLWQFLSGTETSLLSAADRKDRMHAVTAALERLKPEYREVITLAFFDQLATAEIAERLGISRPAATMLLIRSIKALRRNVTGSSQAGGGSDGP